MERKLTAILCADVEGYSRLMGVDEETTIRTLTSYQKVMAFLIELHRGREAAYEEESMRLFAISSQGCAGSFVC